MNTQPTAQTPTAELPADFFYGFTHEALSAAFKTVENPEDWKDEIKAYVEPEVIKVTVAAIKFFTATTPIVTWSPMLEKFVVYSIGYRMGPAGDH